MAAFKFKNTIEHKSKGIKAAQILAGSSQRAGRARARALLRQKEALSVDPAAREQTFTKDS